MDRYFRPLYYCLCLFMLFVSCKHKEKQVTRSYYFWRSGNNVIDEEKKYLKQHRISKLYSKLMDIDWSEVYGAYPVASSNLDDMNYVLNVEDSIGASVIPVIFITNKTFQSIDSGNIPQLAKRIVRRCLPGYDSTDIRYEDRNNIYTSIDKYRPLYPKEIQFDCDWT